MFRRPRRPHTKSAAQRGGTRRRSVLAWRPLPAEEITGEMNTFYPAANPYSASWFTHGGADKTKNAAQETPPGGAKVVLMNSLPPQRERALKPYHTHKSPRRAEANKKPPGQLREPGGPQFGAGATRLQRLAVPGTICCAQGPFLDLCSITAIPQDGGRCPFRLQLTCLPSRAERPPCGPAGRKCDSRK